MTRNVCPFCQKAFKDWKEYTAHRRKMEIVARVERRMRRYIIGKGPQ